jgi:hypothetical protein
MDLSALLTEVKRQNETKRDYVASTQEGIRLVDASGMEGFGDEVALVTLTPNGLQRFQITEHCHRQIAGRLQIPWKYYNRLLTDHRDLVLDQVNALFNREPETRMVRTLDNKARAFLSDKFLPLDNVDTLEAVLPPLVKQEVSNVLLSANVDENKMYLKVLFNDPALTQRIGTTRDGKADTVHPGVVISNSETGQGAFKINGFFYRDFCRNGCAFGVTEAFSYSRSHLGSKIDIGEITFSEETRRKQQELIVCEMGDALKALTDPVQVTKMGDRLRLVKDRDAVRQPIAAIDLLVKEVDDLREGDRASILENFIADQDYSQWGMVNAVTSLANDADGTYERACEVERIGAKLLTLSLKQWDHYVMAEAA